MINAIAYTINGTKSENVALPKEVFGQVISEAILAQSVRVYLSNQRKSPAKTKTRSEVSKTTAKMYKQKGTGRARHGSYSAPIFVGGGVSLGPDGRQNFERKMPKKMIKSALICALSQKAKDKEIVVVTGANKVSGKTGEVKKLMNIIGGSGILVVTAKDQGMARRSFSNLETVNYCIESKQLTAYSVVGAKIIVVTSEAVDEINKYVN